MKKDYRRQDIQFQKRNQITSRKFFALVGVPPSVRSQPPAVVGVRALVTAARQSQRASKIRLDSPKFMQAAHALYRSFVFKDIPAYPEVEIPEAFRKYLLFIELDLS